MSQPNSTRTPFDDDLVFDPNAPRHTQPLPVPNANTPNASAPTPMQNPGVPNVYVHGAPQSAPIPPQVMPNRVAPDDDFIPTRKLHPSTRGGFLVAGGALAVLVLSVVIGKLLPRTPNNTPTRIPTTPSSGTIVMAPPDENRDRVTTQSSRDVENRDSTGNKENANASITVLPEESDAPASTRDASSEENARGSAALPTDSSPRTIRSRRGYALDIPGGFRLKRSGRRTLWTHRDGTNLLVETASADGTPREGWEKLDRALSRKYGAKYRSHGIRETTVDGRNAAVWEFELDLPSGTVRKIDMAVHDGKRGFAVLGSAPAANFEAARGKIESAINSFRVNGNESDNTSSESSTRDSSAREYSRRDSSARVSSPDGSDVVGDISRAASDVAKSAAGSVASAARRQVAESGIGERVKSTVKSTLNGAVNRAVDGVAGGGSASRREPRASTRDRKIESPQPDSESESSVAPVRNEGY